MIKEDFLNHLGNTEKLKVFNNCTLDFININQKYIDGILSSSERKLELTQLSNKMKQEITNIVNNTEYFLTK